MEVLYILCYLSMNERKMASFESESSVIEFVKSSKASTVFQKFYSIDCDGNVVQYELKFNGTFQLQKVGEE